MHTIDTFITFLDRLTTCLRKLLKKTWVILIDKKLKVFRCFMNHLCSADHLGGSYYVMAFTNNVPLFY